LEMSAVGLWTLLALMIALLGFPPQLLQLGC
jgi:hypothetical protein